MNLPRASPAAVAQQAKRHIGQILISQGILTEDQLRQKALALQYYRRVVELAAKRPVSFDLTQVYIRIQELQRQ